MHYNPTNLKEAEAAAAEYGVTITKFTYKIIRKTSEYNKYIKWFTKIFRADKSLLSSEGYRTRKKAVECITKRREPLPIGRTYSVMYLQEIT